MARASILTGLVGCGIARSRSPGMHENEAAAQGVPLVYKLFDLQQVPDNLAKILDAAALLGFAGLNVTHPFKQRVIPLIDDLSEDARRIGAVNTVIRDRGCWVGHNTDGIGFGDSLERALGAPDLAHVVQFGAGGAGSATADVMLARGAQALTIVDPEQSRATALAERLRASFPHADLAIATRVTTLAEASGVVNASPVGMHGHAGVPFDLSLLSPRQWVADVVYFPRETGLLRAASAAGCQTVDGSGMAVLQAARAFELFTGLEADRARMLAAFERPDS